MTFFTILSILKSQTQGTVLDYLFDNPEDANSLGTVGTKQVPSSAFSDF